MKKFEYTEQTMNDISLIASRYEEMNQKPIPRIIIEKVKPYLAEGMEAELIIRALEKAEVRSAPLEYAEAILNRLLEEEILTVWAWDFNVELKKRIKKYRELLPKSRYTDEQIVMIATVLMLKERYGAEIDERFGKFLIENANKPFKLDEICDKD